MDVLFLRMAGKMEFEQEIERAKFDYVWFKRPSWKVVVVEHENEEDTAFESMGELDKLLLADADLRVLVTLVKRRNGSENHKEERRRQVEKRLNQWLPANRNPELLLILGRYTDWAKSPKEEPWTIFLWRRNRKGKWLSTDKSVGNQDWRCRLPTDIEN